VIADLGTLGGCCSNSAAINQAGQVIGIANTAGDVEQHAFVANIADITPICNGQTATIYVDAQGRIVGGPDNGKLYNGKLKGTSGADVIVSTDGSDNIDAKAGNDAVCGGAGDDKLLGGGGNDTLTGGIGADKFRGAAGTDTATDFNPAEGDTQTGVENL
jgi:probable HAF family extracellular repeat protein